MPVPPVFAVGPERDDEDDDDDDDGGVLVDGGVVLVFNGLFVRSIGLFDEGFDDAV